MNSRDKVVQSAFDLLILNGVANLSVNDMLRELKMTKGGFYYYFKSKEELISEIIDKHVLEILWRQLKRAKNDNLVDDINLDTKEKLRRLYTIIPNPSILNDNGEEVKSYSVKNYFFMLYDLIDRYPKLNEGYRYYYEENRSVIEQIINEGKLKRCIKDEIDAADFAQLIMAIRDGMFSFYMINDENCIIKRLESSFEVIWNQLNNEVV